MIPRKAEFRSVYACLLVVLFAGLLPDGVAADAAASPELVLIPAGTYLPLYRSAVDPKVVPVPSFWIEASPVTNREFLEFVRANPRWRRSQVKRLFAEDGYLKAWAGDLELGTHVLAEAPVTYVSWFAAKAYATWKGRRLPTVAEWEYVASQPVDSTNSAAAAEFRQRLAAWYTSPAPSRLPEVGHTPPNRFGVGDLHGLVWEWVADFNTAMVTGDARGDSGLDRQLFCGAGASGAKDPGDFPAFMRFGFRSSLKADYTVHNLGFRCAKDL